MWAVLQGSGHHSSSTNHLMLLIVLRSKTENSLLFIFVLPVSTPVHTSRLWEYITRDRKLVPMWFVLFFKADTDTDYY